MSYSLIGREFQKKIDLFASTCASGWQTRQIGLECSLMTGDSWGDFHCLANISEICKSCRFEDPAWIQMVELFNGWLERDFLKENHIVRTILEFDIGNSLAWPPIPNICVLFQPNYAKSISAVSNILPSYIGNKRVFDAVNRFLSNGWTIDGVGLMLARKDCLRVLFRTRSDVNFLMGFFSDLKLFGVVDFLRDVFAEFPIRPFLFEIDINYRGVISPRVGIDIPAESDSFSEALTIEALCGRNLIDKDKKLALLSWKKMDRLTSSTDKELVFKDIHHFKLVTAPKQKISVKAYLSSRYVKEPSLVGAP